MKLKIKYFGLQNGVKALNIIFFHLGLSGFGKQQNYLKKQAIVAFTGKPDPDDVLKGKWPVKKHQFYKKIYKQLKTPDWVVENWL